MITFQTPRRWAAMAVAACLLTGTSAHAADGQTHAIIDNLRIELIDLDPADNLTPTLQWHTPEFWSWSVFDGTKADSNTAGTESYSALHGSVTAVTSTTGVASHAFVDGTAPRRTAPYSFYTQSMYESRFTLSPNTGLSITAVASINVAEQPPATSGQASLVFSGDLHASADASEDTQRQLVMLETEQHGSRVSNLALYLRTGSSAGTGQLSLVTHAYTSLAQDPSIPPVPEPSTWGMLLGGLSCVGLALRRKGKVDGVTSKSHMIPGEKA